MFENKKKMIYEIISASASARAKIAPKVKSWPKVSTKVTPQGVGEVSKGKCIEMGSL